MDQALFVGLFRHVLQLGAGYLVAKGYVDADGANALSGAFLGLVTAGWFVWDRRKVAK